MKLAEIYRLRGEACERLAKRTSDPVAANDYRALAQQWHLVTEECLSAKSITQLALSIYRALVRTPVLH
jgi:hypothetical protein